MDLEANEIEPLASASAAEEVVEKKAKQTSFKSPGDDNNDNKEYWDLVYLRNTRNSLLQLTDKYLLSDFPISDDKRYEIIEYRQYLRNFINENKEGILNGVIPEIPPIPI
jgi:hypothetical protein